MRLFLDCEFNGFGGELISLALVDENNQSFYEVLACQNPIPWVVEHVIPILNQTPISLEAFQKQLQKFLNLYDAIEIIADWPEDFALFSRCLIVSAGRCLSLPPLKMQLWMQESNAKVASQQPHNALADAQALKLSYTIQ
ncbi:3'-5' exonuclease family protein [Acinetobacter rongchengensis]|uniref:Uncharacterized protein n=1 Tax=Acinetobacter rongchengensis TaxID=2419601 RepID=A0A3A8EVR3_9GAMM|nr:hypothetical protein [Acinetobacter rongchengensis]RKG38937.1 hypothetical protein D7V20_06615 [Acinetobacter rongchengensis]